MYLKKSVLSAKAFLGSTDFTVKSLTSPTETTKNLPNIKDQNWTPLLQSLLAWVSKFPPLSQLKAEDRTLLLENSWHLIFAFHFMCQFGKSLIQGTSLITYFYG